MTDNVWLEVIEANIPSSTTRDQATRPTVTRSIGFRRRGVKESFNQVKFNSINNAQVQ